MASPWRDTTALPPGTDRAAFEACPAVASNGHRGVDPMELAVQAALEERFFDLGVDVDRAAWWVG
jgi:hypothetical protein